MVRNIIFTAVFLLAGCSLEYYPEVLNFRNEAKSTSDFQNQELKSSGYYYTLKTHDGQNFIDAFILYKDGTLYYPRVYPLYTNVNEHYEDYYYKRMFNKMKRKKKAWGKYTIHGDTLKMKFLSGGGVKKIKFVTVDFLIKNKTTLLLLRENENLTFYFKELQRKPDSTNWLMKY